MSALSRLRRLYRESKTPPKVTADEKQDRLFAAGYALGFRHALEEAIEMLEEEDDG